MEKCSIGFSSLHRFDKMEFWWYANKHTSLSQGGYHGKEKNIRHAKKDQTITAEIVYPWPTDERNGRAAGEHLRESAMQMCPGGETPTILLFSKH